MKTIFICTERKFPYGDAGAVRVLNIAKILKKIEYNVQIYAMGQNREVDLDIASGIYKIEDFQYYNLRKMQRKIINLLINFFFSGFNTYRLLNEHITSGKYDVSNIMIYSSNIFYVLPIFLGIRIKHKIPVCFDVVEWYMPFQYKLGIFDLNFIDVAFCFNFIFPLSKNIIAISKLIQNHFTAKKCNILYLPAITDIDEITPLSINEKTDNKIRLIYPGNPGKKDALDIALEAVSLLNDEEKNRIEFHITGMSSNELSEYMQDKKDVLSKLSDCLVIHGKLPYDELMKLYNIVDFLALFRYDNRVTRANFPNKIPELFALGVSVITNKVGDYGECLNDMANSIIVDECSVESAMLGIRKVLALEQSELLIIKNNAKTTAAEYFDYRNWLQSFKMFLENTKV